MKIKLSDLKIENTIRSTRTLIAGKQPVKLSVLLEVESDEALDFEKDRFLLGKIQSGMNRSLEKILIEEGIIEQKDPLLARW